MTYKILLFSSLLLGILPTAGVTETAAAPKIKVDNSTIPQFDLNRYLGKWYEIARYDHRFERGLEGTTAEYSLRPDGKIRVINSGRKDSLDGRRTEAIGKAKPNPNGKPGQLKVSFFGPFYGDYYILELDQQNYSYAVVGSSSDRYLWILSRTPQMSETVKNDLLQRLQKRGYNTSTLIWVKQPMEIQK